MVVKVHCGTVLDEFAAVLKMRPQNSPTMHFETISTWFPAQPQSGEFCWSKKEKWKREEKAQSPYPLGLM